MDVFERVITRLDRLKVLNAEIGVAQAAAERLPGLEREITEERGALLEDLERMDVTSPGNFGWERRIVSFLATFKHRVEARPRLLNSDQASQVGEARGTIVAAG